MYRLLEPYKYKHRPKQLNLATMYRTCALQVTQKYHQETQLLPTPFSNRHKFYMLVYKCTVLLSIIDRNNYLYIYIYTFNIYSTIGKVRYFRYTSDCGLKAQTQIQQWCQ